MQTIKMFLKLANMLPHYLSQSIKIYHNHANVANSYLPLEFISYAPTNMHFQNNSRWKLALIIVQCFDAAGYGDVATHKDSP